jgi:putative membrane protein
VRLILKSLENIERLSYLRSIIMAIIKLFHVFAVFIWVGSLLTLSRLLAYQAKEPGEIQLKLGKILKRMYLAVDLPAMLLTIALGLTSIFVKGVNWKAPWLHMKLTFVFMLIVCDFFIGKKIILHSKEPIQGRGRRYKVFHSLAGLFFIGILIAIYIFKPAV